MLLKNRSKQLEKLMPALSNLYRLMATSRDSFLGSFNLSRPQMELLLALKKTSRTTTQLAEEFSVSSSAVSQMVDQLVERKLVERRVDTADKRVTNIQLSEGGKKLFEEIYALFLKNVEERFKTVSTKEIEALTSTISKVTNLVNKG